MHKGSRKIESGIFDEYTKKNVYNLQSKGYFDTLDYPVSTGKEADVFRGTTSNGEFVAVKIYRVETTRFKKMIDYLMYDPRFTGIKETKRGIVEAWCKKEFRNLRDAEEVGVACPKPIKAFKNVLLMDFVGDGKGNACPKMKDVLKKLENPEEVIEKVKRYIDLLYKEAELVHSDLSEYNILIKEEEPILIDMGQAISVKHPMAKEFLERDMRNIDRLSRKI